MKKSSKDEKKARETYRTHVIAAVEQFRKTPLGYGERRYLTRKDFLPNRLRQEVVEVMCDYLEAHGQSVEDLFVFQEVENAQSRALWYTYATYSENAATGKKHAVKSGDDSFDPHGEGKSVFEVDVRVLQPNVHVVAEALYLYLHETGEPLFAAAAFEAFLRGFGQPGAAEAVKRAALQTLLKDVSAVNINVLLRLTTLARALPEAARRAMEAKIGPAVLRVGGGSQEQDRNTAALRGEAFGLLCREATALLPAHYTPSEHRLGQARHFALTERLKESEWELLLSISDAPIQCKGGETVVHEHTLQTHLYRIKWGSFSVYVGDTRVGELIALDWFGEAAFLGNHFSRARVVADRKGGALFALPYGKLSAVLLSRPDLARKFYGHVAVESASRLNVAMIMASQGMTKDVAVDPHLEVVQHPMRKAEVTRERTAEESKFLYDANLHAVRAWPCLRLPEEGKKKRHAAPLDGHFFVFPQRLVNLYQKGHSEKRCEVLFSAVRQFTLEPQGSRIKIEYAVGKKMKSMTLEFRSAASAEAVVFVTTGIRNGDLATTAVKEFGPVSGVALFDFQPGARPHELRLAAGERLTVLDQASPHWYYGFKTAAPDHKGLFPVAFVELRPLGVAQHGTMQAEDWKAVDVFMEHVSLAKGQYATVEGDPVQSGNLMFVQSGELLALRSLPNGLSQELGFIHPGETFGELMFLLGGDPRASILVTSETAEILRLPRARLVELLAGDVFGAKFWRGLACITSSRLNATQSRLSVTPPIPEAIAFVVAPEQLVRAQSLQSVPSLPALPPPELDPKDELIRKIKARGAFFLGVDVPANVAAPAPGPAAAPAAK